MALRDSIPSKPIHPDYVSSSFRPFGPGTPAYTLYVTNRVKFGPGIEEDLTYAVVVQATYPPPAATLGGDLADTAKAITRKIHRVPSLLEFIA